MSATIAAAYDAYVLARRQLLVEVARSCPGPHAPVSHRDDHMPPWCEACGRTRHGIQIRGEQG